MTRRDWMYLPKKNVLVRQVWHDCAKMVKRREDESTRFFFAIFIFFFRCFVITSNKNRFLTYLKGCRKRLKHYSSIRVWEKHGNRYVKVWIVDSILECWPSVFWEITMNWHRFGRFFSELRQRKWLRLCWKATYSH